MGGQNLDRSFTLPDSTSKYTFQVARNINTDSQAVSCISPPARVDMTVFPEHLFYLTWWIDGFFQLLNKESDATKTFLAILILAASTATNEPTSATQSNLTGSDINPKLPKKRRAFGGDYGRQENL